MIPLAILASIACHHVSIRGCEVYGRFAGREPLINPLVLGFVNGWRICFGLFFGGAFFFLACGAWVGWGARGCGGCGGCGELARRGGGGRGAFSLGMRLCGKRTEHYSPSPDLVLGF